MDKHDATGGDYVTLSEVRTLPDGARALIARQDGVIARSQAVTQGVSDAQVRTRLRRREWIPLHPAVFFSVEHEMSAAARVRAAVLWAGPRAVLCGAAAAWWWQLTTIEPVTVQIVTPPSSHRRNRSGVTVVRRKLPYQDRSWSRALPVTGQALTALHGAVALGPAGPAVLDRALQTSVTLTAIRQAHYRNLGCRGSKAAGKLLQAAADGSAAVSERLLMTGLRAAGISGWRVNRPLDLPSSTVIPDFTFAREKVVIEVDGWAWHSTPDRLQRDRRRQNELIAAGWRVLRFTWFDLTERMDAVLGEIRHLLTQPPLR